VNAARLKLRPGEVNGNRENRACLAIRTHEEVAAILGITPQASHQTERRALQKIRQALWKEKVELYG
jgi:DNA-directed RNA polymerase sigma subunit (sigma70/sigma32)